MAIRKTTKSRTRPRKVAARGRGQSARSAQDANTFRRKYVVTGYEAEWGEFIESVEMQLEARAALSKELRRSPFYSTPNVVKRAVYSFIRNEVSKRQLLALEATIDKSRVDNADINAVLRTLRKAIEDEPYFWVLIGLHLDCPAANLRMADVTRFAQHLNYADRHDVPPEFLVGFLLQSGSLPEIYRRAKDPTHREPWHLGRMPSPPCGDNSHSLNVRALCRPTAAADDALEAAAGTLQAGPGHRASAGHSGDRIGTSGQVDALDRHHL